MKRMRAIPFILVWISASSFCSAASEVNRSWDELARILVEGKKVTVTRMNSSEVEGKLTGITGDSITMQGKGAPQTVQRVDVNLTELMHLFVGQNVREQLESDLKLEIGAVAQYNAAIKVATDAGDNASRGLFERLLKDEESHVDWLEAQLHQIKEIGYERYLSQQIREEK